MSGPDGDARPGPGEAPPAARIAVRAAAAVLAAAGLAALVLSFVPYARAGAYLAATFPDRASLFTPAFEHALALRVRVAGAGALALAVGVLLLRRRLEAVLAGAARDLAGWIAEDGRSAARSLGAVGAPWRLGLLLVSATGLALRFVYLGQPMRFDEAFTVLRYASKPLVVGLSVYSAPNNHLLHTLLVHLAILVGGLSPEVVRLPAFVAGVLLIPVSAAFAWTCLGGPAEALVTATLVAGSSALVEYSCNARGYTLLALLFLLLMIVSERLRARMHPGAWLAWVVLSVLGFWTIPTFLYAWVMAVVWLLRPLAGEGGAAWRRRAARTARAGVWTLAGVVLVYLPPIAVTGLHAIVGNEFVRPLGLADLARAWPLSVLHTWRHWTEALPFGAGALLLAGLAVGLVRRPAIAVGLALCAAISLAQRVAPVPRVWLFLLPVVLAAAVTGLGTVVGPLGRARRPAAGVLAGGRSVGFVTLSVALAALVSGLTLRAGTVLRSPDTGIFPDAQALTLYLERALVPGECVLAATPSSRPLQYYFLLRALDSRPLLPCPADAPQVLVVTNRVAGPTSVQGVLQAVGYSARGLGPPRLARVYASAFVYRMRRRPQ